MKTCLMFTPEEIFKKWRIYIENLSPADRYRKVKREHNLEQLLKLIKSANLDYSHAMSFKEEVKDILTAQGTRLANSDLIQWRTQVGLEYEEAIQKLFKVKEKSHEERPSSHTVPSDIVLDEDIMEWVANKFGKNCPVDLIEKAHTVGHQLNLMFLEDYYVD